MVTKLKTAKTRFVYALQHPTDAASLATFRIGFGLLTLASTIRFWLKGWIETSYLQPNFHFKYFGFDWVSMLPGSGAYWLYAVLGVSSLSLAIGLWSRTSAALVFLTFTYAEMIDQTLYLNHYYLVSLIALLLIFIPSGQCWSIESYRRQPRHQSI